MSNVTIPEALLRVTIDRALALRELVGDGKNTDKLEFFCPECHERVKPFRAGGQSPAHFEHLTGRTTCPLAYKGNGVVSEPSQE